MSILRDLLAPSRLTHVVDVGANPITNERQYTPPYAPMLAEGLCQLTGFEPQAHALRQLLDKRGPNERYLPYAVGDGGTHTLHVTSSRGMTSLLPPDQANLKVLGRLLAAAQVVERIPMGTRRLDDIVEIEHLDFLKIDIQGSELAVFQNGRNKLAECVAIQVEVAFLTFYEGQPTQGDIDGELRGQGFVPHCFAEMKNWPIAPALLRAGNQVLEADIVYVRDFFRPDELTDEQLKHLALIAHHCYQSFDLALRCVQVLEERRAVAPGAVRHYAGQPGTPIASDQGLLPAEVQCDLNDAEAVFNLAQRCFAQNNFAEARQLYLRRITMGGTDPESYCAVYGLARSMAELGEPWQEVEQVYLRAWQLRPTRAEPLYAVARQHRKDRDYEGGYLLATKAVQIPLPEADLLVDAEVYAWRARYEQAACAHYLFSTSVVFELCCYLLAQPGIPDPERQWIEAEHDACVPMMTDTVSAAQHPPPRHQQPEMAETTAELAPMRFVIASPEPDGYHSFDDLAETLHYALVALGHDSVLTKSLDLGTFGDRCAIVLSPNYVARFGIDVPANSILYNFEQVHADSGWMTPALLALFRRHPVWDYSQANINRLTAWGVPRLVHVPVGYVPEMTRIAPVVEDVDVLFYGRIDDRRQVLLDRLRARGLRVQALDQVYGAGRDAWIARSKVVVNIHAGRYIEPVFEIARVAYLLANRRAVVAERGSNPDDERGFEPGIAFADYDQLVDRCAELVGDDQARCALAERGFQIFATHRETDIVRQALSATTKGPPDVHL